MDETYGRQESPDARQEKCQAEAMKSPQPKRNSAPEIHAAHAVSRQDQLLTLSRGSIGNLGVCGRRFCVPAIGTCRLEDSVLALKRFLEEYLTRAAPGFHCFPVSVSGDCGVRSRGKNKGTV